MGSAILRNFAVSICEARQHWTMDEFVGKEIARIRQLVGEKGQVIGGYPRHMQGLHYANFVQALYLGESTLRFVTIVIMLQISLPLKTVGKDRSSTLANDHIGMRTRCNNFYEKDGMLLRKSLSTNR